MHTFPISRWFYVEYIIMSWKTHAAMKMVNLDIFRPIYKPKFAKKYLSYVNCNAHMLPTIWYVKWFVNQVCFKEVSMKSEDMLMS